MGIGAVSGYGYSSYNPAFSGLVGVSAGAVSGATGAVSSAQGADKAEDSKPVLNPGESKEVQPGKKVSPAECQTCKERKYQDGSDEQVSFKSASHISPQASAARVRGHEQEHVSNAYKKAAEGNGKVMQASVSLKTAVCPECGRSYVAGGTTTTRIAYSKESNENPYFKNMKAQLDDAVKGQNLDFAV